MGYIILFISNLFIYFVCFICKKYYSKFPNITVGYRSSFAIKNLDTWKEANLSVEKFARVGLVILIVFNTFLLSLNIKPSIIVLLINSIVQLIFIFYTEIHLRRKFDKDGKLI